VVTVAEPVGELAAGGGAGKTLTAAHRTHGHISHCTIAYVGTSAVKPADFNLQDRKPDDSDFVQSLNLNSIDPTYVHRRFRRLQKR